MSNRYLWLVLLRISIFYILLKRFALVNALFFENLLQISNPKCKFNVYKRVQNPEYTALKQFYY